MSSVLWQVRARAAIAADHPRVWLAVTATALVVVTLFGASQGAVDLSVADLWAALTNESSRFHVVVWNVRLPRLLCGALVGMNLAVAGTVLQTTLRNPLADPGILGVSAGAGLGALIVILLFPGHSTFVPWAAFIGGGLAIATLLGLAWSRHQVGATLRIVLSGVAMQAILFAAIALLTFAFADRAPAFAAFMVGSLNGLGWNEVSLLLAPTLAGLALAAIALRTLDLLLLDDSAASALGVPVQAARFGGACIAALLTAAAVSVAGLVGFVGLVVPNALRLLVGPGHDKLLPAAALGGAALVVFADTFARTVLAPLELPVGALLSVIGGPYFLYLLWRKLS